MMDTPKTRKSEDMDDNVISPTPSSPCHVSPFHVSPLSSPWTTRSPFPWDQRASEVIDMSPSISAKSPVEMEPCRIHPPELNPSNLSKLSQPNRKYFPFRTSGEDNSERMGGELRHETKDVMSTRTFHKLVCKWKLCGQMFTSQRQLSTHVNDDHVRLERPELDFNCHWQGCPRLGKGFNARYKMLIHIRTHTNEKPHSCPMCGKCFSRLENLKIHTRSHTGEKPYLCTFPGCGKAYSNSSDRFKHVRTHQEEKPYKCKMPGCQKQYTDPSSLRKHVRTYGHTFGLGGAESRRVSGAEDCGVFETNSRRNNVNIHHELCSKYQSDASWPLTYDPFTTGGTQKNSLLGETKMDSLISFESRPDGVQDMTTSIVGMDRVIHTDEIGVNKGLHLNNLCLTLYKHDIPPGDDHKSSANNMCPYSGGVLDFEIRCPESKGDKIHHDTGSDVKVYTLPDINSNVSKKQGETNKSVCSVPIFLDEEIACPTVRPQIKSPGQECRSLYQRNVTYDKEEKIPMMTSNIPTTGNFPTSSSTSTQHWKKRKIVHSELEQKAVALTTNTSTELPCPRPQSSGQSPHQPTQTPHQLPHLPTQILHHSPHPPTETSKLSPHLPTLSPNILQLSQESSTPLTAHPCSPDLVRNLYPFTPQTNQSCHAVSPLSSYTQSQLSSYTHSPLSSFSTDSPPLEFHTSSKYYTNTLSPSCLKNPPLVTPPSPNRSKGDFLALNFPMHPPPQLPYKDQHPLVCSPSSASSHPYVSLPSMFPMHLHSHHSISSSDYLGGHILHPYISSSPLLCASKLHDSLPARYLVSLTPILDIPTLSPLMELLYPADISPYNEQYYLQARKHGHQIYTSQI